MRLLGQLLGCRSHRHPLCDGHCLPACLPHPLPKPRQLFGGWCTAEAVAPSLPKPEAKKGKMHILELATGARQLLCPELVKFGVKMQLIAVSNVIYLSSYLFIFSFLCAHTYTCLKAQLQLCSGSKLHMYQESCHVQVTDLGHFHFLSIRKVMNLPPKAQQQPSSPFIPRVVRTCSLSVAQGLPPCISCIWVRRVVT